MFSSVSWHCCWLFNYLASAVDHCAGQLPNHHLDQGLGLHCQWNPQGMHCSTTDASARTILFFVIVNRTINLKYADRSLCQGLQPRIRWVFSSDLLRVFKYFGVHLRLPSACSEYWSLFSPGEVGQCLIAEYGNLLWSLKEDSLRSRLCLQLFIFCIELRSWICVMFLDVESRISKDIFNSRFGSS